MQRQTFRFKPSRWLAALLLAGHAAVVAALSQLDLPLWAISALSLLLSVNWGYLLWREAMLRSPQSCLVMQVAEDEIVLQLRNGRRVPAQLCAGSLVTPWLTVLNLKPQAGGWKRGVVILPDSLEAESFRQLRVCLKWGYRPPV